MPAEQLRGTAKRSAGDTRAATRYACDLLVVGSGAGGLSAAIRAAHGGLKVLVVDTDDHIGGTTAISGGWLYVPGNKKGSEHDGESRERFTTYLRAIAGRYYNERAVETFLDAVPEMMEFFENETDVEFVYPQLAPDYQMQAPGAMAGGRNAYAAPINGAALGADRMRLHPYKRELTVLGVMPQIGPDLEQFLHANQSPSAFFYVTKRILRNWAERLVFRRGLDLSNGNALVARMVLSARKLGVEIWTSSTAERLVTSDGATRGAVISRGHDEVAVHASHGVVLACGGFTQSPALRSTLMAHTPSGEGHYSPVNVNHIGENLRLAEPLGGYISNEVLQPAAWAPVSVFRGAGGRERVFPHLRGVGLPGIIAVTSDGKRFTNEADSYHEFISALIDKEKGAADVHAFLICDARTKHKYGLGFAKPWPLPEFPYLHNGYLIKARSLGELAAKAGIDATTLSDTIATFNEGARVGEDRLFGRGVDEFNRFKGDPLHTPNPSLAPVEQAPFYATRVQTGDLGSYAGLAIDPRARVLTREGEIIPGLFAVGTAALTVFGGTYPGPGANIGPAMALGYLVGRDVAEVPTTAP